MKTSDTSRRRNFLKYALAGLVMLISGGLINPAGLLAVESIKFLNYAYVLGIHSVPTKGLEEELLNFGYK
ncbi:MAG: hypothetical protein O7G32_01405, partial [SAR324 cluster bacterium]|nr:hypothetical protein [SAR324 cluster bacterium]